MAQEKDGQYNYKNFDSLLNSPIRLAIMSLLMGCEEAEFTYIRDTVGATDGNLSRHLAKLEEEKLIKVDKRFEGKKPVTYQRLTGLGRSALRGYLEKLEALIASIKK